MATVLAIGGIVASLVSPALELGKCFKKHFIYLCCLGKNINDLKVDADKLEEARADLQVKVDAASRNVDLILPAVKTWLTQAETSQGVANVIITTPHIPAAAICSLKQRYSLSRKAMKTTESINELVVESRNFNTVAIPGKLNTPAASLKGTMIESRNVKEVETWLTNAEATQGVANVIIDTHHIPAAAICSLKQRYSLSRKAMKTTESINELLGEIRNFNINVANPPLPAAMVPAPPPRTKRETDQSRMTIEDDIIKAMRDGEVNVIGLWGMGGVGKTTMAQRVMGRAREKEGLFDEVLMVDVGQQADMLKIQSEIAVWLGLKLDEEALEPRARRLRARLTDPKRKLIVIDDVWESIDLEKLGIPCNTGSCKVLLTSRDKKAFDVTDNKKVFKVATLSDDEAWFMFKENAGACLDDSNLLQKAREVAKECKGLPLALVVVAKTLKDEKDVRVWSDALTQLRRGNPIGMPDVIEKVYNHIKLSIDFLDSPQAKSLLFLCSSFPEDTNISREDLVLFGFGLCMFDEDIINLEGARNRIATLLSTLKSRSLILDTEYGEGYVKMHDVVRDVVIFIGSKEKQAIVEFSSIDRSRENPYSDCTMLSVVPKESKIELLPMELASTFPNLHFLWMRYHEYGEPHSMSDQFFKGMQHLKVLYINSFSLGSTPQTMQLPKNLHTLHLKCCTLKSLSPVGELSSLEILICHDCHSITELPVEISKLNRLRHLEVSCCRNLKTIKSGIISRLDRLEELKMNNSFKGWESGEKGNERSNVSLVELEPLCNLTCLEIQIDDATLAAQELQLLASSKIEKYDITVGKKFGWEVLGSDANHGKKLCLNLPRETLNLRHWIDVFARSADYLHLVGDVSNSFDFASEEYTRNKRYLDLRYCATVEKFGVFPVLETLCLVSLPNLVEISTNSFAKLNKIEISGCGKLRSLFSSSVVIRSLSQLQTIEIKDCESMEEVFSIELQEKNTITFPKLEKLSLFDLKSLTTLCKAIDDDINIEFPRLVTLFIVRCPKLMTTFDNIEADQNHLNCSSRSLHLLCNKKLKFGSLKELFIAGRYRNPIYIWCPNIPHPFFRQLEDLNIQFCANRSSLFSYSIAANLVNLKKLFIRRCRRVIYVIGDDKTETKPLIIFHKLEEVTLNSLPKLQSFCEGRWDLQFPSLTWVNIQDCPRMEGFTMGSISTPNLNHFEVDQQMKSVGDFIKHPWAMARLQG